MAADLVHPFAPRVAQGITAMLCVEALVFQEPGVVVVALALVVLGLIGHPWSPVGWLVRFVTPPARDLEPRAPVRFSQALAVIFLALAGGAFLVDLALVGWVLTGIVAALALLASVGGVCVGCEIYRLLLAGRTSDEDVRSLLALEGGGPWMVVLTAPGCARCGPVADLVTERLGAEEVTVVDLAERPEAAGLPVKTVPAVLAIASGGEIVETHTGALDEAGVDRMAALV